MNRPITKILFSFIFLSFLVLPAGAQRRSSRFQIDGERIKSYINWLSQDELQGRKSGTEGYRKAADWVATQYQKWGVAPGGENGTYFQEVPIRGYTWNVGVPALNIDGRMFYLPDGDFTLGSTSTAGTTVNTEIIFVGHGISAPGKGLDEYKFVDVAGKVVLILKGNPHDAPAPTGGRFNPGESKLPDLEADFTPEATDQYKITTAYEQGALAVLLYDPAGVAAAGAARGSRGGRGGSAGLVPERNFLTFTIEERVFRAIMRADEQESKGGLQRRIDAYRRSIRKGNDCSMATGKIAYLKGYDEVIEHNEENENNMARNVIAKIEGTDPELKDEIVVVGGHLDHLGVRDGIIYNGADDDASGSAVTMEVARLLHEGGFRPKRTILFCCWCGEEMGTVGSRYFVDNAYSDVTIDKVVTYLNMDMVGVGEFLVAPGGLDYPTIWEVIERDQGRDVLAKLQPSLTTRLSSDHAAFIRQGVMGIALQTREGVGHLDYHQPEDDAWKIQPEALRITGEFVIQAAMNLANETEVELIIPNRKELYESSSQTPPAITNINPELEGSAWMYVTIPAEDKSGLQSLLLQKAWERLNTQQGQTGGRMQAGARLQVRGGITRPVRGAIAQGIRSNQVKLFDGEKQLFEMGMRLLGFGRIDVEGNDGYLVSDGRLTTAGKEALKVMEDNGIAVHLMDPPENLVYDVLEAADRPFIITGSYTINEDMFERINEKQVLIGINFTPDEVADCIERLDNARELLGDSDNLVLFVAETEGLEEAARELQAGLKEAGWEDNEIAGRRNGIFGGNLGVLGR